MSHGAIRNQFALLVSAAVIRQVFIGLRVLPPQPKIYISINWIAADGFMWHYYDAYSLLRRSDMQALIGTDTYKAHKQNRFGQDDEPEIALNQLSFSPIPRRASSAPKPTPLARRFISAESRPLTKFSRSLEMG